MKKLTRFVCVVLVVSLCLAVPAYAQTAVEPRGSAFFGCYGTDLYKTGTRSFQIWFDVTANVYNMDVLGVSEIILYRSTDMQSWVEVKTYTPNVFAEMLDYDSYSYINYVPYYVATPGCYYTAYITFYAKNSTGIGERYVYTEILQM